MRRVQNGLLAFTAALSFAFAGIACENTRRGVEQDTSEMSDEARDEAAEAADESRDYGDDAQRTARDAGGAVDAVGETIDVKTALIGDDTIDSSDINVDTFHETKTVVLKGSVPTAAQKESAARVAAREAEGYKVENQLTVRPR